MADEVKLIDRDEVGAKIQAMYIRREIDYGGENEFCRGMRKALRIIEDVPTVEVQPDNGWISVKDRLPDVSTAHTSQLVMVFSTNNEYEIYFDVYNSLSGKFMSEAQNGCKVTHWRHLPEPPKGE